jgi:hypothetical protein
MAGKWKPPKEQRIDTDAVRRERQFREDLREILDHGTEEDFVGLLKAHRPEIKPEELRMAIMQFRVYLREKRGLC